MTKKHILNPKFPIGQCTKIIKVIFSNKDDIGIVMSCPMAYNFSRYAGEGIISYSIPAKYQSTILFTLKRLFYQK